MKVLLRIEADTIGGKSKVFLNGIQLSQEEIERTEILYDMNEDESYVPIDIPKLDKCYKYTGIEDTIYIAYGNLNEKDEYNRRLAFSALLQGKQINESSLLSILSSEFRKINYTFANNDSISPTQNNGTNHSGNVNKVQGRSNIKLYVSLLIIAFFVILLFILL